jgi:hypothetical protein
MWTTISNDNVLGSSMRLITNDFKLMQIASIMHKNTTTHKAKFNAEVLHDNYLELFGIDIHVDGRYMTSDTTSAA